MKRFLAMLMAAAMTLGLTACGSSSASGSEPNADTTVPSNASASAEETPETSEASQMDDTAAQGDTVNMIYFLDLKDGSIMAACYDDAGVQSMGADYIKVYVEDAEITDADGNPMQLSDLVRGCFMQVTFPGMVTMSIPAQISATKIVVTDNTDHGIVDEDEIPDLFGTGKWWEEDVVDQAPDLVVQYSDSLGLYSQMIPYKTGAWSYDSSSAMEGGATNAALDGQKPQAWTFDDSNTIRRREFDTVKLTFAPAPETMTVTAYRQDDPDDAGTEVPVKDGGEIALLDCDYNWVYVVSGQWNSDHYQGQAIYGFLVTAAE